jgi:hypothetical protein
VTITAPAPAPPADVPSDRRVIVTVIACQLAGCLGYFAVMSHLVAHLRHDVGLLAGTIGLIMGIRVGVQFALLLPVGAITDAIGARRTGVIACAIRAVGFGLLGTADDVGALLCAAVAIAAGGALSNPAAQSLLASVHPDRRSGGFGAYVATQHIGTIAGPPLGLGLLALGHGFVPVAAMAAALWALGGVLFLSLPPQKTKTTTPRFVDVLTGIAAVFRDRRFVLFALMTAPTTLLANHIMTAVPLLGFSSAAATVCLCVLAAVAASAQPFVASNRRGEHPWTLRAGLLCAAGAFFVLAPLDGTQTGPLMLAAVLNGVANGLIQPSIFQRAARHAPTERFGSYYGVLAFCAGMFSSAGDLVIGRLFDLGPTAATAALLGVGVFALISAFGTRGP